MHLEALQETRVAWPNGFRNFRRGEHIHTENSYKDRIDDLAGLLGRAGFSNSLRWTNPEQWFANFPARP